MNLRTTVLSAAFVLALVPAAARAQSGGAYEITRSTHSGGGLIPVTGGEYALGGSIGQADAGVLAGGEFSLIGGFWGGTAIATTGAGPASDLIPKVFSSRLASANPFTQSLSIAFALPSAQRVALVIYGVDGRVIRRLPTFERQAGRHQITWDGSDEAGQRIAPGIYFVKLRAGRFSATHRVVRLD
jgi:hypothetical protein